MKFLKFLVGCFIVPVPLGDFLKAVWDEASAWKAPIIVWAFALSCVVTAVIRALVLPGAKP